MWIDTHCHCAALSDEELEKTLSYASENMVSGIIDAGTDIATSRCALHHARTHAMIYATAGVSPADASEVNEGWDIQLEGMLGSESVVGVGEIGLDGYHCGPEHMQRQEPVFMRQLELALQYGLTAVVHSRGAERQVLERCRAAGMTNVVFHCFTGEKEVLREVLDSGYYVSYSGIVTFKNSNVGDLAMYTPTDRICVETDSPYLSPVPFRGKPNTPANVKYTADTIARIKKRSSYELANAIAHTMSHLFPRMNPLKLVHME